ncbi:MAG: SagB family peptide dehydrogenase [Bacillota bacterium]|nr:SagB family peptide dehydrogenase [Bacillota bacterium]
MKLDTFLSNLHFDVEKALPQNWKVDWGDAPLPYKLYRDLPEIPLSPKASFSLEGRVATLKPNLADISQFLWYVYGLTQYAQTVFPGMITDGKSSYMGQSMRRFVPSGGALYPNELYIYLKLADIPEGIYHYSAAHHNIVLLREGNFDSYLSRSLGKDINITECFGTLFVSTVFWKNFYKYHNFSYRLQGLDAGAVLGQALAVADQMDISTRVCYQFLDRPINHLLGLYEQEESVYAVIPLAKQPVICHDGKDTSISSASLCEELPVLKHTVYQRSKNIIDYPMLKKLNEAAMFEFTDSFVKLGKAKHYQNVISMETIMLPYTEPLKYDFDLVCRERHSPDLDFQLGKISQTHLATLLKETLSFVYNNDLVESDERPENRVSLYGCFSNVESIPIGAYSYEENTHALKRISSGDYREYLQNGLTMDNVNLFQVPMCFHIVGDKDFNIGKIGYRGYRIQQMEAGIVLQRLLLTAGALGLGGHPLLGYDVKSCDELYQLNPKQKTCLIQIPVGPYRPRAWLKGSLE